MNLDLRHRLSTIAEQWRHRPAILSGLLLIGCGIPADEYVAWARSPDGRIHATPVETNGGATTSHGYLVALHTGHHQGAAMKVGRLYGAVRSACAYGVGLRWRDPATLAIRNLRARQVDVSPSVEIGERRIRILVEEGHTDPDAPCGGMAASLPGAINS